MVKKKEPVFDAEIVESTWDKKKIAIGVGVLVLLIGGWIAGNKYLAASQQPQHLISVQGTSTDNSDTQAQVTEAPSGVHLSLPSKDTVNSAIQDIQSQVQQINVQEIATTSPQVQSILKEIKSLPSIPGQAAKDTCMQICSGL